MTEVYLVSGVHARTNKRVILAVTATAKGADKNFSRFFGEGSIYYNGQIEVWEVAEDDD